MALVDLWRNSPDQLADKRIDQIIVFAGDGKLRDASDTSSELRAFLADVPSAKLRQYADECLTTSFTDSGLVLQDIVNQIGARLGFKVAHGRYRGAGAHIGYDGLWRLGDEHAFVVEVKTTDAFRISLDTLENYQRELVRIGNIDEEGSSILVVVGRRDTGDFEAQVRGSRLAWDVRLISVDSLFSMLALKESVEDPKIERQIHTILIPQEFTRLDGIVEMLFSTAKEVKQEEAEEDVVDHEEDDTATEQDRATPVSFNDASVARIQQQLDRNLIRRSRAKYSTADGTLALTCAVSKAHAKSGRTSYWFAFHVHQKEFLEEAEEAFVAFGCGSEENVILIPFYDFVKWLEGMNITSSEDRFYWHVSIFSENGKLVLHRRRDYPRIDLSQYVLPN